MTSTSLKLNDDTRFKLEELIIARKTNQNAVLRALIDEAYTNLCYQRIDEDARALTAALNQADTPAEQDETDAR